MKCSRDITHHLHLEADAHLCFQFSSNIVSSKTAVSTVNIPLLLNGMVSNDESETPILGQWLDAGMILHESSEIHLILHWLDGSAKKD